MFVKNVELAVYIYILFNLVDSFEKYKTFIFMPYCFIYGSVFYVLDYITISSFTKNKMSNLNNSFKCYFVLLFSL